VTKTPTCASVSTVMGSDSNSTPKSTGVTVNKKLISTAAVSAHSTKVTTTKNSTVDNAQAIKKPKTVTSTLSSSNPIVALQLSKKRPLSCYLPNTFDIPEHRATNHPKIGHLPNFKHGHEMECVVTEVASPSEFWIQPAGYELINLMVNLE